MQTVLVVDDDEVLRRLYTLALSALGYSVTTADHGMEALKICAEKPSPFDLIIIDWLMPVMSGASLKQHLEKMYPNTPIIVASGSVDPSEVVLCNNQVFLQKPFTVNTLREIINSIYGRPIEDYGSG